ncbi:PTS sugar transporter subunit IIB [Limosilactobacillus difficilis]|uniref:PTS sugar transporter subunit IIB n=1 Tax=Limosilactobacillus difficilis TaxID=2991838 RepID=UPI0024B8F62A|nr:PTS sugar transporter subunit IIB [Limosilactobacillus difficilis]
MAEKTIMLCCSAGMSTSMLVTRMQKAAKEAGKDVEIFACPSSEAHDKMEHNDIDLIMLGTQVRYMENDFKKLIDGTNTKLTIIDMSAYGTMNGSKVLDQAYDIMGAN